MNTYSDNINNGSMIHYHIPVMAQEILQYLSPKSDGFYLDGTMGGAGHSALILQASSPDGRLLALDRDDDAIRYGKEHLSCFGERVAVLKSNFSDISFVARSYAPEGFDGILLDLGVSSFQLDEAERGFSYMKEGRLDMRMDQSQELDAKYLVNHETEERLAEILYTYGEEKWAKRIAKFIVEERKKEPIETTGRLVEIVKAAIPKGAREKDQHPAKRTFQAIRIVVNDELGELEKGIESTVSVLKPGGRIAIITFHSLEDRIVKEKFRFLAQDCICPPHTPICICKHKAVLKLITRKPVLPSESEVLNNPRSRSAKLRVAEKLATF